MGSRRTGPLMYWVYDSWRCAVLHIDDNISPAMQKENQNQHKTGTFLPILRSLNRNEKTRLEKKTNS